MYLFGLLITVASIAGIGVLFEGATGCFTWLLAWARARRASPSREGRKPTTEDDDVNNDS